MGRQKEELLEREEQARLHTPKCEPAFSGPPKSGVRAFPQGESPGLAQNCDDTRAWVW
jgi:hypothetical protein